ncbi:MAG TPA: DUF4214 domain-containing protein [Sumerlaeia bacterium]|nr:DUF4214 domain-containing protein [Sumerlaeia bacterium]
MSETTKTRGFLTADRLCLLILLLAGLKFTFGVEDVFDVSLHDDSYYLYRGVVLREEGLPHPSWAPVYVLWHFALSLIRSDRIGLYFLNCKILTGLLPIGLFLLLRRHRVAPLAALCVSFFLLISGANLPTWPKPSHFSVLLALVFLILTSRTKSLWRMVFWHSLGALLVSYVRPEFFLAYLVLVACLFVLTGMRRKSPRFGQCACGLIALLVVSGAALAVLGTPAPTASDAQVGKYDYMEKRGFFAFAQHFAVNWASWTKSDLEPWRYWQSIVFESFGDVNSIEDAFLASPALFSRHVRSNVFGAARRFPSFASDHYPLLCPDSPFFRIVEQWLAIVAAVFAVCKWRGKWRGRLARRCQEEKGTFLVFGAYFFSSLVAILLIYPRGHYLLMPFVLVLIPLSLLVFREEGVPRLVGTKPLVLLGVALVSVAPSVGSRAPADRSNVATIGFIQSLSVDREVLLLAPDPYHFYLGDNYKWFPTLEKPPGVDAFLDDNKINMIVVSEGLRKDIRPSVEREWARFFKAPNAKGFLQMEIPFTGRQLLVEETLMTDTFIDDFYRGALGRDPKPVEREFWLERYAMLTKDYGIDARFLLREMGSRVFRSAEYAERGRTKKERADDFYRAFLNRKGSRKETRTWEEMDWGLGKMAEHFVASSECDYRLRRLFPDRQGEGSKNLLAEMSMELLGRVADSEAFRDESSRLDSVSRLRRAAKRIAAEIVVSEGFLARQPTASDYVTHFYRAFLGRSPTHSEMQYWRGEILTGRGGPLDLIDLFADSGEFTARLERNVGGLEPSQAENDLEQEAASSRVLPHGPGDAKAAIVGHSESRTGAVP